MDSARFDELLRSLASGISRRTALGATLSGFFASGAVALLAEDSEAKHHHHKKKKKKKCKNCSECQVCQKGKCASKPDGTTCSTGVCEGGVCGCPSDQTCDFAGICCPSTLQDFDGAGVCDTGGGNFVLCSCPAGDDHCQNDQGEQCCLPADTCDPVNLCSGTCSAQNDFCEIEWAACGDGCACFTDADGNTQVCADLTNFVGCPQNSECDDDGDCSSGQACVDLSCCDTTKPFVGVCLDECAVGRSGSVAKAHHRSGRDRLRLQPIR
jgi:hypothetical protein